MYKTDEKMSYHQWLEFRAEMLRLRGSLSWTQISKLLLAPSGYAASAFAHRGVADPRHLAVMKSFTPAVLRNGLRKELQAVEPDLPGEDAKQSLVEDLVAAARAAPLNLTLDKISRLAGYGSSNGLAEAMKRKSVPQSKVDMLSQGIAHAYQLHYSAGLAVGINPATEVETFVEEKATGPTPSPTPSRSGAPARGKLTVEEEPALKVAADPGSLQRNPSVHQHNSVFGSLRPPPEPIQARSIEEILAEVAEGLLEAATKLEEVTKKPGLAGMLKKPLLEKKEEILALANSLL